MVRTYIGYGYTNSEGVATLDYDSDGNELPKKSYACHSKNTRLVAETSIDNVVTSSNSIRFCENYISELLEIIPDKTVVQTNETIDISAKAILNGVVAKNTAIYFFEKIMPELSLSSSNPIIQSGEKSNITSKLYDSDDGSILVGERIDFYEVYTPSIKLGSLNPIIQSGDKSNVKATLIDSEDGSFVSGERIDFYEIYTPSVVVSANNSIIQVGDASQLSAKVKDSDGSLISDEVVYFYVVEED